MKDIAKLFGLCFLVGVVLTLCFYGLGAFGATLSEVAFAAVIAAIITGTGLAIIRICV